MPHYKSNTNIVISISIMIGIIDIIIIIIIIVFNIISVIIIIIVVLVARSEQSYTISVLFSLVTRRGRNGPGLHDRRTGASRRSCDGVPSSANTLLVRPGSAEGNADRGC